MTNLNNIRFQGQQAKTLSANTATQSQLNATTNHKKQAADATQIRTNANGDSVQFGCSSCG